MESIKGKDTEENRIIGGEKIISEVILEYGGKEQKGYDECQIERLQKINLTNIVNGLKKDFRVARRAAILTYNSKAENKALIVQI